MHSLFTCSFWYLFYQQIHQLLLSQWLNHRLLINYQISICTHMRQTTSISLRVFEGISSVCIQLFYIERDRLDFSDFNSLFYEDIGKLREIVRDYNVCERNSLRRRARRVHLFWTRDPDPVY